MPSGPPGSMTGVALLVARHKGLSRGGGTSGMQGFLEVVGAENAERQLSAFLSEVRSSAPAATLQATHRAVITAAIVTLERRLQSARQVLDSQSAEAAAESRLIEKHVLELENNLAAFADTPERASLDDMAERLLILQDLMPVVDRQTALLLRARQWIDDLRDAAVEWRLRDDATDFGINSPGLLRALTAVSAALDTMTAGVHKNRVGRHASFTDRGFARLVQLGGAVQDPSEQSKKTKLSDARDRLSRISDRMAEMGAIAPGRERNRQAGSVDHGGA